MVLWIDYKRSFGNLIAEIWFWTDKIHPVTINATNTPRVDLKDVHGKAAFAEFNEFSMASEKTKYQRWILAIIRALTVILPMTIVFHRFPPQIGGKVDRAGMTWNKWKPEQRSESLKRSEMKIRLKNFF